MPRNATRLLLVDNYDSFTYNLVHYLGELGAELTVERNDVASPDHVAQGRYDGIVISPGPCDPDRAGYTLPVIQYASENAIPLLGVCLGHQALGQHFGGKVIRAPQPMHGKISAITHTQKGVFATLPSPYNATRYHSLIVERSTLPDTLKVTAETADGIIMGLQHKTLPLHGVQFHPESIASEHGHLLLKNFLGIVHTR